MTRGWIGVQIQPVTADDRRQPRPQDGRGRAGCRAAGRTARPPRPASRPGDVITAVNGEPVKDARDLAQQIGALAPGADGQARRHRARARRRPSALTLGELPKRARGARRDSDSRRRRAGTDEPRLGLTLAPAGNVAGSGGEGVVVTDVDPDGPGRRARLQDRRRDPRGRRQGGRDPGRRAQGARRCPHRRQAHRADAREVGRGDQVRRAAGSAAPRPEWGVPSAFVAPAGGANPGDGPVPVPIHLPDRHPSPPPDRGRSRGGGDPPPPAFRAASRCDCRRER